MASREPARQCVNCGDHWLRSKGQSLNLCPRCESTSHICSICSEVKAHGQFHKNPTRRSGYDSRCRPCAIGYKLQQRYGIDAAEYSRRFTEQGGLCAICNLPSPEGQPLVVDHCHVGLQVRGLLCSPCNTAIGLLKDNPSVITRAATYVTSHQAA